MIVNWRRSAFIACLLSLALAMPQSASAQTSSLPVPPEIAVVDERGIDLTSLQFVYSETDLSIGQPGAGGLSHTRYLFRGPLTTNRGFSHNFVMSIYNSGNAPKVTLGGRTIKFKHAVAIKSGSTTIGYTYDTKKNDGLVLTSQKPGGLSAPITSYQFIDKDGTKIDFDPTLITDSTGTYSFYIQSHALASKITHPDGEVDTFAYKKASYNVYNCSGGGTGCGTYVTFRVTRLQSLSNNLGYQIHYSHGINTITGIDTAAADEWMRVAKVAVINLAQNYCDPTADGCSSDNGSISYTQDPLPTPSYDLTLTNYTYATLPDGRVRRYRFDSQGSRITGIKSFGSASDDFTLTYDYNDLISGFHPSYTTIFWGYTKELYSDGRINLVGVQTTESGTPAFHRHIQLGWSADNTQVLGLYTDTASSDVYPYPSYWNRTYSYDTYGRVSTIDDNKAVVTTTYDDRGNVLSKSVQSKYGSAVGPLTESATYDTTCSNPITCNLPSTTTDMAGGVTTYTYDATHGGVLTVTSPAATSGGVQPQARTAYTQLYAYYKDTSGSIVVAPSGIYRPTSASSCITTASCAGTADEVKTTITYGATSVANNLLPTATTVAAGDGSISSTTAVAYDAAGNRISEDGPLSGSADTTIWAYNAYRQVTQVVSPDPDGTGPLHNRSAKTTYNANGQVLSVSSGTANADGSGFVELRRADTSFDSYSRKVKDTATAGGSIQSRTDYHYDIFGRLDCAAVRMNPAVFATSTTDACTLGTAGTFGPDRITHTVYDGANRALKIQTAYGTSYQRDEITRTYDAERLTSVADAKGNLTTYSYDDTSRLIKTSYPSPTTAGQSSTTDYEQLTYSSVGRLASQRLRDGKQISYTYDNLGRQTLAHMVNPLDANDRDIATSYDLLSRVTQVDDGNGKKVSFGYDQLGRKLSESPQLTGGSTTYQYDAAGRRTRLTWSDGFYVTYDYDTLGEMLAVRENGATSGIGVLATFAYDDDGKPNSLTRGNGVNSSYTYDAAGRLATYAITHPTAGNSYSFAYNPANQLISRGMTNDAYAWTQPVSVNRNYTTNGLNQYTASGAVVPTYDGRGNTTSAGATAYTYDSKNQLNGFGSNGLGYDAEGHLATQATPATRFVYDSSDLIAETDSSNNILRRYVHIPESDYVLVWYEGSGTSDKRWLAYDERGSTTLITDASGVSIAINAYDENGIPQSTNLGRFQYTGQAWLPEMGMYYYKARIYSATLGRFMQTDPKGYDDGPNWYNYVHSDPINHLDFSGEKSDKAIPKADLTHTYVIPIPNIGDYVDGPGGLDTNDTTTNLLWLNMALTRVNVSGNGYESYFDTVSFQHFPIGDGHAATSIWWHRFDAIPGAAKTLEALLDTILSNPSVVGDKISLSAKEAGLPGGKDTFYQRFDLTGFLHNTPGVLDGARLFYDPDTAHFYLAPFHGKGDINVPTGYILLEIDYTINRPTF